MSQTCNQEQKRPVMKRVCGIIGDEQPEVDSCNPGLWLDKFAMPGEQKKQHEEIKHVCLLNDNVKKEGFALLVDARSNRETTFGKNALKFTAQTTGSFTLHLARALALENAGICLHPVYGFAYIPGTAIKGMAHAFACGVWLPTQSNKQEAWDKVCKVFGWAPSPWLNELVKDLKKKCDCDIAVREGASVGDIIFHDAWPVEWPGLICDIANNHHQKYYSGEDNMPPGDWENPKPVYFLAVKPETEFDFALSLNSIAAIKHAQATDDDITDLLKLAGQWLLGVLEHRGAGAKTNSGYGRFELVEKSEEDKTLKAESKRIWDKAIREGNFCEETFTLELVTPAFLAGANQEKEDCHLRPATLRGHLRWWWRTMYAGHLDIATLKELEDAIWGNTKNSGIVNITLTCLNTDFHRTLNRHNHILNC
ncbi:MAG: type III-B CRISPR module RAMP protein Cmr6 [Candidatus Omnitrophica bacterium]|nr:type III-B CRISPR module RAMP protein Cmr6 [Candidatus Omnitrophota bacterium]